MKKFLLFFLVLAGALFSSCKKEVVNNNTTVNNVAQQNLNVCATLRIDSIEATVMSGPLQVINPAPVPPENYMMVRTDAGINMGVMFTGQQPSIGSRALVRYKLIQQTSNAYQYTTKPIDDVVICGQYNSTLMIFRRYF